MLRFLLTNAIVLTMDATLTQHEPGAVAVQGDHIAAVGPEAELRTQFPAAQIIDCGGKVLMPGLVNAHGHAAMTLLRGLADDLRLDVWLLGYMMPVEREFVSPSSVHLGTLLACAEMIRSGTTCFADMYYFEDSVARADRPGGACAGCWARPCSSSPRRTPRRSKSRWRRPVRSCKPGRVIR